MRRQAGFEERLRGRRPCAPTGSAELGIRQYLAGGQRVEEVSDDEIWKRLQDPVYAEAMRAAQETLDAELGGRRRRGSSAPVKPS